MIANEQGPGMFSFLLLLLAVATNVAPVNEQTSFPSSIPSLFVSYPELYFLARRDLSLAKEPLFSKEKSYSQALFNERFDALDQTLLSLKCLSLIFEGSPSAYEELVVAQPVPLRLSKESFAQLHEIALTLTKSHPTISPHEMFRICQAAVILKAFDQTAVKEKNELFSSLSKEGKEFLFASCQPINYRHIFHLEGGREMFALLKEKIVAKKATPLSVDFDLFIYLCHLAGREKESLPSSLTEEAFLAFQIARDSLHLLCSSSKEEEAYLMCIEKRASLLHIELKKSSDRTMIRIASLLHLFSPSEGKSLKEAFHSLSYAPKESIFLQFDEKKAPVSTPLYLSDLLLNVFNAPSSGIVVKEKIEKTIHSALPLVAQIFKEYQERVQLGHFDRNVSLNFLKAALFAKQHPQDLDNASYQIDKEGLVTLFLTPENVSEKK
jgi:hypothetical protein